MRVQDSHPLEVRLRDTGPHEGDSGASPLLSRGLLIGLLVFVALAVTHRSFLFIEPWHEHSDYAVNALQIARAGELREIHGNYSQYGFYHPGPAFYYVYALGEQVFYRWLAWVPSPHNAHALAGLLLQSFFFAAALTVADRWIRRPLFIPLMLVLATIHFGLAENAFVSTWPPRVLLMPFLCLLVSAASVAAGRIRDLPLMVLAGCFLVHGHVAQPLFVVTLTSGAYGLAWRRTRQTGHGRTSLVRENQAAHIISAACIALFLVPLVVDLCAGAQSNLLRILDFELNYHEGGKSLRKALIYFIAFFGYVKRPEAFLSALGPDRSEAIGEIVAAYFVWAAVLIAVLVYLARMMRREARTERPFVLSLAGFTALAFLLSLYWGTAQISRLYEYHGYFNYSILCGILFLLGAAVSALPVPKPRLVGAILCVAAGLITWQRQHTQFVDHSTNDIVVAVDAALQADPQPSAPKYLLFPNADWGEAISIGLALKRAGCGFRADTDWGPKFDPESAFEPKPPAFALNGLSTWRLSRIGPPEVGSLIRNDLRVYFQPLPLDPTNGVIDCRPGGNLELYTLFGFSSSPDQAATWTMSPYAGLVFDSPPVTADLLVSISAEPSQRPGDGAGQPMTLQVNGHEVLTCTLTDRRTVTARVPAKVWNAKNPVTAVFHLPDAVSPHRLGLSMDERMLGWHIETITFRTAP